MAVSTETRLLAPPPEDNPCGCLQELETLSVKPQERYKFIRSIGFGGMKGVLLVYDRDTCREVAMAIIPDFRDRDHSCLERFVREAKLTAQLEHPNIVPVHDIGIDASGSPYYTMTYLRGSSLAVILKRLRKRDEATMRQYNLERRLQIFLRVCNAVNYAHSRKVCHLDLKPENINIGEFGEVMLLDWGLAAETDDEGHIKLPPGWNPKGTPGYMPPEQIDRHSKIPVGYASDIYTLGALLYAMLALSPPFLGSSELEILRKTMTQIPCRPSKAAPKGIRVPPTLEKICARAMDRDPRRRYATVSDFRRDIVNFHNNLLNRAMWTWPLRLLLAGTMLAVLLELAILIHSFLQ